VEVKPSSNRFDTVIIINVGGVHQDCIDNVDDGIIRDWGEFFEISKELPTALEITRAEVDYLL
jgi:hypothetical protein